MKKCSIFSFFIIIFCVFVNMNSKAVAQEFSVNPVIYPDIIQVTINEKEKLELQAYTINGKIYLQLHELSLILSNYTGRFKFVRDNKTKVIQIIPNTSVNTQLETLNPQMFSTYKSMTWSYHKNQTKVNSNNKTQTFNTYTIDNNIYFQINDLPKFLNIKVTQKDQNPIIHTKVLPNIKLVETKSGNENFIEFDSQWSEPIQSFIYENADGTTSTLDVDKKIVITTYSSNYKKISEKTLDLELPLFGTFYSGEKYNYIVYGKKNLKEENIEVIRIVKYDKKFNRIAATSIKGDDIMTVIPFSYSSGGKIAEQGNVLVYHTSRIRYTSEDGRNHQSQLTLEINTDTMKVINELKAFPWNHVSHSLNQYVLADSKRIAYLDHGDGSPRALVIHKDEAFNIKSKLNVVDIVGPIGSSETGVSVGGFEQSDHHYLVAFNSIEQNLYDSSKHSYVDPEQSRGVYLYSVSKDFTNSANRDIIKTTIVDAKTANTQVTPPSLVKINNDKFAVIWQEYTESGGVRNIKYVLVDGTGKMISKIFTPSNPYRLSLVQPLFKDGNIIWQTQIKNKRIIYELPIK